MYPASLTLSEGWMEKGAGRGFELGGGGYLVS